jgi:hypothetical protein
VLSGELAAIQSEIVSSANGLSGSRCGRAAPKAFSIWADSSWIRASLNKNGLTRVVKESRGRPSGTMVVMIDALAQHQEVRPAPPIGRPSCRFRAGSYSIWCALGCATAGLPLS